VQEKKQKEIEEQRKKKMNRINGKSEMAESAELDTVHLLDILDSANGIYTFGGSLTELSLMMAAYEQYGINNKLDTDLSRDAITNFIKNVVALTNGKSEMQITGPCIERTKLLEVFGSEKPLEVILAA
jgi:exopolyphosphatase/pppGpp-phosphohydrolase